MKKQLLTLFTLLSCVALSAQTVDVRVCQADKFIAGCTVYDRAEGNQTDIPVDLGDKSYTLNLSWGTPATFAYTDSVALGGSYIFGCQTLTTAGTYYDTLTTSTGCDSIVVLTLTEYTPVPPCEEVTFAYTDSMATGGTYIFQCQVLTEAGEYRDTLVKADGCDSIIVLTLTEYTPIPPCEEVTFAYTDSMATGGTYIFQCQVLTEAGEYRDTLVKADGCDSIIVLTLTEYTPVPPCEEVTFEYTDSIAVGGLYIFGCEVLTEGGIYRDTLVKADGCDSIIVLTLTEYTPIPPCEEVTFAYTDSMATGGTYIFQCQVLTEAGEYRDTLVKADGCDSIIVLTLTEYTPIPPCEEVTFEYTDSMAVGGLYIFGCEVLTEGGIYRDTLIKADGCDSIVVLTLNEYSPVIQNETLRDTIAVNLCLGEPFTDRLNVTYYPTQDTVVSDTIMISRDTTPALIHTVDSIYRYEITVQQPKDSLTTATICAGESFNWFGKDYSVADTYYDTLHYTTGCDSIYCQLVLTVQSRYLDSLPALVKDDSWLLMIHRRSIREDYNINFTADQVHWYRVEGEVDEYPFGENNDTEVGTGDYYTIAEKMSGQYYALLDVDVTWIAPCAVRARTVILDCDNPQAVGPILSPTIVPVGGDMTLSHVSEGETTISIFNAAGQRLRSEKRNGQTQYTLQAEGVTGVYMLQVVNESQKKVFKYVVTH